MKWEQIMSNYLQYTRKERIGIITVFVILFTVWFLPRIFPASTSNFSAQDTSWMIEAKKLLQKADTKDQDQVASDNPDDYNYSFQKPANNYFTNQPKELFEFDPNTLSVNGWKKLGLREKTIQTIEHYRSKGGRFRKPEDLQRIYGLRKNEYERLAPFIRIENNQPADADNNVKDKSNTAYKPSDQETRSFEVIDINNADESAFITLPGIGEKLAARIINFRKKLGGFYSVEQMSETYGLPDSTFRNIRKYLTIETTSIKKININTATLDELKAHPYIRYNLANTIVAYRSNHGTFTSTNDIKNLMIVTDDVFQKISPYISTQ